MANRKGRNQARAQVGKEGWVIACCMLLGTAFAGCSSLAPKDCVALVVQEDWNVEQGRELRLSEQQWRGCEAELKSKWEALTYREQYAVLILANHFEDKAYEAEARDALGYEWKDSDAKQGEDRLPDLFVTVVAARYVMDYFGDAGKVAVKERISKNVDVAAGMFIRSRYREFDQETKDFVKGLHRDIKSGKVPSTPLGEQRVARAISEAP